MSDSQLERLLLFQIKAICLPEPQQEYRFAAAHVGLSKGIKARLKAARLHDWRFDFAWPSIAFAVEVEGVTASGGRHQRIGGFIVDIEKYHHALALGWTVYRTTGKLIKNGQSLNLIEQIVKKRGLNE